MELSAPRSITTLAKASVYQLDGFQALAQCSYRSFAGFILNGGKRNEFIMEIGDRFGPYLFMMCVPQLMGDDDIRVLLYFIPYRVVFTDVQDAAPGDSDSSESCIVPLEVFLNLPERDAYYSGLSEQDLLKLFPHVKSCLNSPSFDSDANAALQRSTSINTLFHDSDSEVASVKLTSQENSYASSTPSATRKSSRRAARLVDTSNIIESPRLRVPVLSPPSQVIHTPTSIYKDQRKAQRATKKKADPAAAKAARENKALLKAAAKKETKKKEAAATVLTTSAPMVSETYPSHNVSPNIAAYLTEIAQTLHHVCELTSQNQSDLKAVSAATTATSKELTLFKKKCADQAQEPQRLNHKINEFSDLHRTTTTSTTSTPPLPNTNPMGGGSVGNGHVVFSDQYPHAAPAGASYAPAALGSALYVPAAPAGAQHASAALAGAQHASAALAGAQHASAALAGAQHAHAPPAGAQHASAALAGASYAHALPAGAQHESAALAGASYAHALPAGAQHASAALAGASYAQHAPTGVGLLTVDQYGQMLHTSFNVFQEIHHRIQANEYFSKGLKR